MVLMQSLVLERKSELAIREVDVCDELGPHDCRVKIHSVGICGSDVHYYEHGRIGPFVVEKPMILGHEASGTVVAVGTDVKELKAGDRVALEPGIPRWDSAQTLSGLYNLDPELTFFATPPVHGCMSTTIIHPAALCFKLPDNVSYEEGALCEPIAVGMHSVTKAGVKPGDVGLVIGCGTIGIMTALSALTGGCSEVIVCGSHDARLEITHRYPGLRAVNTSRAGELKRVVAEATEGKGCDVIFECGGAASAFPLIYEHAAPGATCVLVGMPIEPVPFDVVMAQAKEITFQTVFRYRNVYPRIIRLLSSGKMDVKPLISATFAFKDSVKAYERAMNRDPKDMKIMIPCVLVGMPIEPVPFDVVMAQAKEITFQTVFRYRNVYPRIIRLLSSGKMDVKPLISATFAFKDSVKAYERAMNRDPKDMKIMIRVYGDKTNML
ncbi:LOW QUALITY PROTEIN: putative Alcohol dehydrogenase GroES-like domain/Zinc-binding dehydrogenase [Leishmania shawi]|uniref:Alcohol dehydrogenase GroES-like domain/Zinc-binding dehydrogenase n=1 Tax=Leishmania shawi TaxID=5680 RepID=A0ABR3EGD9_9TRYP